MTASRAHVRLAEVSNKEPRLFILNKSMSGESSSPLVREKIHTNKKPLRLLIKFFIGQKPKSNPSGKIASPLFPLKKFYKTKIQIHPQRRA